MENAVRRKFLREIQRQDAGIDVIEKFRIENPSINWPQLIYSKTGDSILHVCARLGYVHMINYIICNWPPSNVDCKNNDCKTALHEAAQFSQCETVKVLLDFGAQVDALKRADWTPLMLACTKTGEQSLQIVKLLLTHGASVKTFNKDGWTALHLACRAGDENIVNLLIKHDLHTVNSSTFNGRSTLHIASLHGHYIIVKLLLNYVKVDVTDNCGNTPFHDAVCNGNTEIVNLLLAYGSDINSVNNTGFSCLHLAASEGLILMLKYLILEKKMNPNIKTTSNLTPLHCAGRKKKAEVMKLLEEFGANPKIKDCHGRLANDYFVL